MTINDAKLSFGNTMTKRKTTDTICLHHTGVTVKQTVEGIHNYHRYTNGWAGIGYHYYVRKDGSVWKGRSDEYTGAHCPKVNANSIGICFEGNFETEKMSNAQLNSGIELIEYVVKKYPAIKNIVRHKDVASTACPGKNFPFDKMKNYNISKAETENKNTVKVPFKVKITDEKLNIRQGAGTTYKITGVITDNGVYTITQIKGTAGESGSWGRLKSGKGWISLYKDYVKIL